MKNNEEATEGKWCKVWDETEREYVIAKILNYGVNTLFPYVGELESYLNAEVITDCDLIKKLEKI